MQVIIVVKGVPEKFRSNRNVTIYITIFCKIKTLVGNCILARIHDFIVVWIQREKHCSNLVTKDILIMDLRKYSTLDFFNWKHFQDQVHPGNCNV